MIETRYKQQKLTKKYWHRFVSLLNEYKIFLYFLNTVNIISIHFIFIKEIDTVSFNSPYEFVIQDII